MSKPLKIAFMGTPAFSVPALDALLESRHEVTCVYTQPPRPKGRGKKVQLSPVHALALARGIPVYTPQSLKKDAGAQDKFLSHDVDLAVVAAYGLILPKAVLDAPKYGCLNIHASLLPRWRGAAPIQSAILAGDTESGITIMQMEEGLDTGPMIEKATVPINLTTTAQSLHDDLASLGGRMIVPIVDRLTADGVLTAETQDDSLSCYAPMLTKADGLVDWIRPAAEIDRQIRALNPWPGIWTTGPDGRRLKILAARPAADVGAEKPGKVLNRDGVVACGKGTALQLTKVQPENAKAMDVVPAINGGYISVGAVCG